MNPFEIEMAFISIHALLAESDRGTAEIRIPTRAFLSTLSLRRATQIGKE